jgi:hypothetical protein
MRKTKTCSYTLQVGEELIPLNTEKLLLGSSDSCDITMSHDSISHYHAMIFIDETGSVSIMDLESQNGIYINGNKITSKTVFFDGDSLTIGKLHTQVLESQEPVNFDQREAQVHIYEELQADKVYVPLQANENEILIDDEYCDIVFDDSQFTPNIDNPIHNHSIHLDSFIDQDDMEDGFDILQANDGQCIQVTTSLHGSILEQYYYPVQDGTIMASNKARKKNVVIDILDSDKNTPLFKINNGLIEVMDLEGMHISKDSMELDSKSTIVISRGTYQVFIELADAPNSLLQISSLIRDRAFFMDSAKKFAAVAVPMLLLLLVDFTIEKKKPLKQLSIIYKKPTTAKVDGSKMASKNPNSENKNTGHKAQKQPDKKISHSKSGQKQKTPPKKAQKAVAKTKSAPPKKATKAKAKTKAYQFKMATNVNSVFSTSKSVAVSNSRSPSSVSTSSSVSGSLATKVNGTSSNQIGNMGSDSAGSSAGSFGSQGLSSKSGRDTAYIQTQTVVLGSMDPELLRKILQQYLPQFRHCYQQELVYNSDDIKGIVDLNFEISGVGKVGKIKVRAKDSRFSKRGTNCMRDVLAIIDFPKPKGGGRVAVRQPLSFFSEKERG